MTRPVRAAVLAAFSIAAAFGPGGPAFAAYPDKPIKVVVGFPAGGPLDQHARLLADRLQSVPTRSPRARPTATRSCSPTPAWP